MVKQRKLFVTFLLICSQSFLLCPFMAYGGWLETDCNHVEIVPLLWDLNMSGRAEVQQKHVHIDQNKPGGIILAKFSHGPFSLLADATYSQVTDHYNRTPFTVKITNKFGIFTGALGYDIYHGSFCKLGCLHTVQLQPYIGLRYTLKDTTAKVSVLTFHTQLSHHQQWLDPIVGLNIAWYFLNDWGFLWSGDIGGTTRQTDYSYQTSAFITYDPSCFARHLRFYAGYRILDQHYASGNPQNYFDWNTKLAGPLAGISIVI